MYECVPVYAVTPPAGHGVVPFLYLQCEYNYYCERNCDYEYN